MSRRAPRRAAGTGTVHRHRGRWRIRLNHQELGTGTYATREEAEAALAGILAAQPRPHELSAPCTAYLDHLARTDVRPQSVTKVREILTSAERDLGRPLLEVTDSGWSAYLARQRDRLAPASYTTRRRALGRMLAWHHAPMPAMLRPQYRTREVPPAWAPLIAEYAISLEAAGYPATTRRLYRGIVERLAAAGTIPDPTAATTRDLLGWLGGHAHWSNETRYSNRGAVRSFYAWAHAAGHVATDPAASLPKVRRRAPSARPIPVAHLSRALTEADERTALMLALAASYGLRRAEVAQVHVRDLLELPDTGNAAPRWLLTVHGKGGKDRQVPITNDLADRIRAAGGYLFPGHYADGHLSPEWVGKLMGRALPAGHSAHGARHLFATTAYAATGDLLSLSELLGHASAQTTRRYVLIDAEAHRRTVEAVARALPIRLPEHTDTHTPDVVALREHRRRNGQDAEPAASRQDVRTGA